MKRKAIIVILLMTVLLGLSIGSYAYFMLELNKTASASVKNGNAEELTQDTFEEVIHQYNTEILEFNSKDMIASKRYNLKFATGIQIVMQHDLVIQFDCNLDLNGGAIDLNGYQMSVKHSYSGVSTICNGTIKNSNLEAISRLSIDTPNAFVKQDNLTLDNVTLLNVSTDTTLLLKSALNFALGNIVHHNLKDALIENYDEVVVLDAAGCSFEHSDPACVGNCIYTYDDLDFIKHYYQYDLTFTYNSSDESILSSTGKIFSTGSVLLKITASYQGSSLETYANVHVIETAEEKITAAKFVLLQYLSRYFDTATNQYLFASNIMLPAGDSYFNCIYHYDVYNGETVLGSDENISPYLEKCGDHHVLLNATSAIQSLVIRVHSNEDTAVKLETGKLAVNASDSQSTFDNTTVASNILNYYYSGKITITESADGSYTITPNTLLTLQAIKDAGIETISNLVNSLVNDNDGTYQIDEGTNSLQIIGSKDTNNEPNELQNVSLKVTFTFTSGTPEEVTKYIPIKFFKDSGGGSETTVSSFRPYYLYYNKYIESTTKGYTYEDFYIPFRLKNNYPLFILNPTIYNEGDATKTPIEVPNLLNIYLVKVLNNNTIEHINNDQYTSAYFYENGATIKTALPAELQNTKIAWYIDIDQTKIPDDNIVIELTYMYCLDNGRNFVFNEDGSGSHMISEFTIPGILRCGAGEAFEDENLYQEIFKIYHSGEYVKDVTYLVVDNVQRNLGNISIDGTKYEQGMLNLSNTSYTSLKGLEYLKSLEKLNLSGCSLATLSSNSAPQIPAIDYISLMESLKYLDLSNTGISDRKVTYGENSNTALPGNNDNQFLQKLSSLTFLEELYLQGNQIYSFSALSDFKNLKKVNVSNNTFQANYNILGGLINLSNIFTNIVNTSYGTNGVTNISTFMSLKNKGVTVEGYVESGSSVEKDIISALNNIEYQNKIGSTDSIDIAYKELSTTLSDYGVSETYTVNVEGNVTITQNSVKLEFVPVGDNEFKLVLTYSYTASYLFQSASFDIVFEVTHKVERQ